MSPRQNMSLGDTLLQLLFRFIVNTVYGAYLPRSYVCSDGLIIIIIIIIIFRYGTWVCVYVSIQVEAILI